ncbi:MAG: radical SAM protein [Gemmatimonadota bacterium]|nr:radical SAM protein [Gemmatimonadota bacterium]MDP6529249.1 radical SAM protein [Gemmatimonadota bacterium]MDP6802910.1 radical SAM protein [Gemmatimonadota bacterium]MDP7031420.1 radical SAM protein [Gemmatimonadota bacterium]
MSTLLVHEIYRSIQGESTRAGRPCVFVRLTGCDLRCAWCDTEHAFHGGTRRAVEDIVAEALGLGEGLVLVTGGEPLLQEAVHDLLRQLLDAGREVMIETGGHRDIRGVDERVLRVVDVKTPSSGESGKVFRANFDPPRKTDEVKFVIADRADFDWSLGRIRDFRLEGRCTILFSAVSGRLAPSLLAEWLLASGIEATLQLQLHRILWPGVLREV